MVSLKTAFLSTEYSLATIRNKSNLKRTWPEPASQIGYFADMEICRTWKLPSLPLCLLLFSSKEKQQRTPIQPLSDAYKWYSTHLLLSYLQQHECYFNPGGKKKDESNRFNQPATSLKVQGREKTGEGSSSFLLQFQTQTEYWSIYFSITAR